MIVSEKLVNFSMKQLPGRVADLLSIFPMMYFKVRILLFLLPGRNLLSLLAQQRRVLSGHLNEFKNDKIIDLDGRRIKISSPELITMLSNLG